MSPFKFPCHHCGQRLAVFAEQIGTTEPCPSCGTMVTVVAPEPAPTPPPEAAAVPAPVEEKAAPKPSVIKISCRSCGQRLSVYAEQIGTTEPCPSCGEMVTVIAPEPAPAPAPEVAAAKAPIDEKATSKAPEPEPKPEPEKALAKPQPVPASAPEAEKKSAADTQPIAEKKPVAEEKPAAEKKPADEKAARPAKDAAPTSKKETAPPRPPPPATKRGERAPVSASPARSTPKTPSERLHRLIERLRVSRYLTISFLLHAFAGMTLGGVVLYHVAPKDPDFVAGSAGLLVEESAPPLPPEASPPGEAMQYQSTPQAPLMSVPVSVITTVQVTPTAPKIAPVAPRGLSDSMKGALAAMDSRRSSPGVSSGGSGTVGGSRWATIFGKRIMAARLGVILDFSASAYPHLPGAVEEIQRGFSDAILILYPGCGMVQFEGNSDHEIRKLSSISPQEIEATRKDFDTTGAQIWSAMKISELAQMASRPTVKDTLFVSWYAPKPASWAKLIGRTQVVFDDLMKRKVDAIYWFSDFADPVDPRVVDHLAAELKTRRIKLHLHNFGDTAINPDIKALAENSGGTVSGSNGNN